MYLIYSVALACALIIGTPFWLVRMLRHGKYRAGLGERFGQVPQRLDLRAAKGCIWLHAVSVGEVLAASGVIRQLQEKFPDHRLFISTTTATGQKLARSRFGEQNVFYFPLDFAFCIRPYLRALNPALVVVAETEFWPNFLRLAGQSGAKIAVVNARISDRSLPRYMALRWLMRSILRPISLYLAQSEEDQRRLMGIGAEPERVRVSGNLKFDVQPPSEPPAIVGQLRTAMLAGGAGPVIVAGSTVEGEEPIVLQAFQSVLRRDAKAVLILAPRHPERFSEVMEIVVSSGLKWWQRSKWNVEDAVCGGVFLLDTIGELGAIYSLADVAFVGGSLAPRGGHNILEPAMYGVATIVGPHTENFRDIIAAFRNQNAVLVADTAEALEAAFMQLITDFGRRRELGENASATVARNTGATERTLGALKELLAATPDRNVERRP